MIEPCLEFSGGPITFKTYAGFGGSFLLMLYQINFAGFCVFVIKRYAVAFGS